MRSKLIQTLAVVIVAAVTLAAQQPQGGAPGGGARGGGAPAVPGLLLTSTAWPDGGLIPAKYASQGAVSPALSWSSVPAGTAEFVLLMHDPEPVRPALSVSGDILHWMVAKIPGTTTSLPEGAGAAGSTLLPEGVRVIQPYRGPAAPAAGPLHHYTLILYALNAPLDLSATADRAAVTAAMEGKVLGRAFFGGRFMLPAAQ